MSCYKPFYVSPSKSGEIEVVTPPDGGIGSSGSYCGIRPAMLLDLSLVTSSSIKKVVATPKPTEKPVYLLVTGNANIRSGAGGEYSKLGNAEPGESYLMLGTATSSTGSTWYKIQYKGKTGYISSNFVKVK